MKLLHIDSSILGEHSASRQVSQRIVDRLKGAGESVEVVHRHRAADPLPPLALANLPSRHPLAVQADAGAGSPPESRRDSDQALQEFLDADVVVIGAPMYNFTVPSQLKAWIDRILVTGVTFRYSADGPEGLVKDKRVVLAPTRGGFYGQGSPAAAFEHLETYLRTVFGFIGVSDIDVVSVEGLSWGPDARSSAMERAQAAAQDLRAA